MKTARSPFERRRAERLGVSSTAPKLSLRAYPPESDNVMGGLRAVLGGSYDVKGLSFAKRPTILDLGAHVGSFSVWASSRWPGARIIAFEPSPANAGYLRQNVVGLNVEVREFAVVGPGSPERVTLFDGKNNTGQRSIHHLGEQRVSGVEVATFNASKLPPCDILKADTEGCELAILRAYPHLDRVKVIMLEWHRVDDYKELLQWLPTLGFDLRTDTAKGKWVADRNLIFVRRGMMEQEARYVASREAERLKPFAATVQGLHVEYDLKSLPDIKDAVVLDIGANVGNFCRYALDRWPGSIVHAFEPHPLTYLRLREAEDLGRVETRNVAVTHPARGVVRLFEGVNGDHECSLRDDVRWPHQSQRLDQWVEVDTIDAATLPPCDVIKVDTEGSEIEILTGYPHLNKVRVLIVEAHAVGGDLMGQATAIRKIAEAAGLRYAGPNPIVSRYVRP